jgi:hypothetical protein
MMQVMTDSFPSGTHFTGWVSVETTNTPCVNEFGSKGRTISTKGVDGVTLKHWTTFRLRAVLSKRERIYGCTITVDSKFSEKYR